MEQDKWHTLRKLAAPVPDTELDLGERLLGPVRGRRPPIAPFSCAARNRPGVGGKRWARPAAERSGVAGRASACIARSGPLFSFPWARSLAVFLLHPLSRLFSEATCFSFRLDCVPARFSGALGRRACDKLGCRRRRSGEPCSQAGPSFAAVTSRASLSVPALPTTSVHSSRFGTMTYWERGPWCRRARLSRDG